MRRPELVAGARRQWPRGPNRRAVHCVAALILSMIFGRIDETLARDGTDCLDTETALDYWRPIRARAATSDLPADQLAIELVACLASPDPELRDRIGYELFTYWLRGGKLADTTRRTLLFALSPLLDDPAHSATLARSFAALVLAELMRSDAVLPFMTANERDRLLAAGLAALQREDDFRGLEPDIGWVHPLAHMADLLWRFALHPDTTPDQARDILVAIRAKVAPTAVFYSFNEGDRLARVAVVLFERRLVAAEDAVAWLTTFETPYSVQRWPDAFESREGMAELHNTRQFLRALSDQSQGMDIDQQVKTNLEALVARFTALI